MHAVGKLVVVVALTGCATGRAGFTADTSSASSGQFEGCGHDPACTSSGTGSQQYLALIGVASMIGLATVHRLVR